MKTSVLRAARGPALAVLGAVALSGCYVEPYYGAYAYRWQAPPPPPPPGGMRPMPGQPGMGQPGMGQPGMGQAMPGMPGVPYSGGATGQSSLGQSSLGQASLGTGEAGECRDVPTRVTIDGKRVNALARTCRQADGKWHFVGS